MKLKDYKNDPEKYVQILNWCKARNIEANDESDIFELFNKIQNADIAYVSEVAQRAIHNNNY